MLERISTGLASFKSDWALISMLFIIGALVLFYWRFERHKVSTREIALIAALAALAAVARLPFAPLPSLQPTTFMVIVSGFVLGPPAGFMIGSTAGLVSNFFLGHGPWTLWQMWGWGLAGLFAGFLGFVLPRMGVKGLPLFSFFWGYIFGWMMNIWSWIAFVYPLTWASLFATCIASFWFDTVHALSNLAFYILFGKTFLKILRRYQRKLRVSKILVAGKMGPGQNA